MGDVPYLNARLRAWRANLLTIPLYETLLHLSDLGGLREALERTVYGKRFDTLPADAAVARLEELLRNEWSQTVARLRRIAGEVPGAVLDIVLGRSEVENLKTILRGKQAKIGSADLVAALLPAGSLDEAALAELARQPSAEAIVALLAAWRSPYARVLKAALREAREHRLESALGGMELALDRFYFSSARERLGGEDQQSRLVRAWLGLLIDRVNLHVAFKLFGVGAGAEMERLFIDGGSGAPLSCCRAVARAHDLGEAAQALEGSRYGALAPELMEELPEGRFLRWARLERSLDRLILGRIRLMARADPLGIGLLLDYLPRKYQEIVNLRLLLRAKVHGIASEEARLLLVAG